MDRNQLIGVFLLAATALFLMSGQPWMRYRRAARVGAITVYGTGLLGVLVWVGLWLLGIDG